MNHRVLSLSSLSPILVDILLLTHHLDIFLKKQKEKKPLVTSRGGKKELVFKKKKES